MRDYYNLLRKRIKPVYSNLTYNRCLRKVVREANKYL